MRHSDFIYTDEYKELKSEIQKSQQDIHMALQNVEYFIANRNIKILHLIKEFEDKMIAKDDREGQEFFEQETRDYKKALHG